MQSLLESKAPKESPWKAAMLEWLWTNIAPISMILAAISSLCSLARLLAGPARSPLLLRKLGDTSLESTGCLIGLYAFAFFFDLSRAKEFWMSKEMGFYSVVVALFFATAFDDLRLFAQNRRWDWNDTVEVLSLGLLWTGRLGKSEEWRDFCTTAIGFHRVLEQQPNEISGLGLSSGGQSDSKADGR